MQLSALSSPAAAPQRSSQTGAFTLEAPGPAESFTPAYRPFSVADVNLNAYYTDEPKPLNFFREPDDASVTMHEFGHASLAEPERFLYPQQQADERELFSNLLVQALNGDEKARQELEAMSQEWRLAR